MKNLPHFSIRARVSLLIVFSTISAIVISVVAFIDQKSLAEAYERSILRGTSDAIADSYETKLLPVATKLTLISRSGHYRTLSGGCRPEIKDIARDSQIVISSGLIDSRGHVVCVMSERGIKPTAVIRQSLVRLSRSKPDSVVTGMGLDPITGQRSLMLLRAAKNGGVFLFAAIDLPIMQKLLLGITKGSQAMLLDNDGMLIATTTTLEPSGQPLDLANLWPIIRSVHGSRPHSIRSRNTIVAYAKTDHSLGYVVATAAPSILYAHPLSAFWRNIVISLVFLLLTTSLAWQALMTPLVRRLKRLRRSAEALGRGNQITRTEADAPLQQGDELTEVSHAFDRMAQSVSLRDRALKTLGIANSTVIHASSETRMLHSMCDVIVTVGGYAAAWICYVQSDTTTSIQPVGWAGKDSERLKAIGLGWNKDRAKLALVDRCIRSGTAQLALNTSDDETPTPWQDLFKQYGYQSTLILPLITTSAPVGALVIHAVETDIFNKFALDLLRQLAADLSYGIDVLRARTQQEQSALRLERSLTKTVQALSQAVELRDPYTAGHQERAARIARAIAQEMTMDENRSRGLSLAASIYDVGKLGVPADILSKPGKLSEPEMAMVKGHAEAGRTILQGIDFPWPVAEIVLQHHERLDGSGYPRGLKGQQILLEARIIAVADVVEAMLSHRPYRGSLGLEKALDEIENGRGVLYDPEVVDACVKVFRRKGLDLMAN